MKRKPCPFCGGPADWCYKGYRLMCQHCCTIVSGNSIDEVEAKWSTRPAPTAPKRKPVVVWVVTSVSRMWGPNCDASLSRSEGREWAKHCRETGCTDVRGPVKAALP
jgi:hypothetical protein